VLVFDSEIQISSIQLPELSMKYAFTSNPTFGIRIRPYPLLLPSLFLHLDVAARFLSYLCLDLASTFDSLISQFPDSNSHNSSARDHRLYSLSIEPARLKPLDLRPLIPQALPPLTVLMLAELNEQEGGERLPRLKSDRLRFHR
jgi:hypothetical protein